MSIFQSRAGWILFAIALLTLSLLGAATSEGLYNIDEAMYLLGAKALHTTGQFGIDNGYATFNSDDLRLWILNLGPNGLVAQYPVGMIIAAAPLVGVFGVKSFVYLNIFATLGSLITSHALANRLFRSDIVANLSVLFLVLCTFWIEFAVAIWPHAMSFFLVSLAILIFLRTLDRETSAWRPAAITGLIIGSGMFFRLEVILLLPAIGLLTIVFARKPVSVVLGGSAGLTPMIALMSYTNWVRFGTLNPLSYGQSVGDGTKIASYISIIVLLLGALAVAILIRNIARNPLNKEQSILLCIGFVGFVAALSLMSSFVQSLVDGIHAILIDARVIEDTRPGATERLPDGTQAFWGQPKKALGQSLPWIGIFAALIGLSWRQHRRSVAIVLVFFSIWALPFLLRSWHGGLGSNMRYLLPMLPLITATTAWLAVEMAKDLPKTRLILLPITAIATLFLTFLWAIQSPYQIFAINQIVSTYVLMGMASLALVAGLVSVSGIRLLTLHMLAASLGLSSYLAFQDYALGQSRRAENLAMSQAVETIPGKVVLYGPPAGYFSAFDDPERLVALPLEKYREIDMAFVTEACADGYRVLFSEFLGEPLAAKEGQISKHTWPEGFDGPSMVEFNCSTPEETQQ